ncbi:MAG: TIGR03986 family CRISPR-associated RAMP protein [Lachnospiraceae bacterium]|nr:TIGR03986 family CRISPR-associated RAMP protein [Lachnospiraceae bacterium]
MGNNFSMQNNSRGNNYNRNWNNNGGRNGGNNSYGRPNSGFNGGKKDRNVAPVDVDAFTTPYNFIPFEKKTLAVEEEKMPVRGILNDELLSGEISYEMNAETPVFVNSGKKDKSFYRNAYGIYAIPGSSIRGAVRANAQVLGVAGYDEDIDDYMLMYRNIANGAEKERYGDLLGSKQVPLNGKTLSVLKNVKAGYISNEKGKYYIYGTKVDKINNTLGEMNYYVISERFIQEQRKYSDFSIFENHKEYLQHDLRGEFRKSERNGKTHYEGTMNKGYAPYYTPVSYRIKDERKVEAIAESGKYAQNGYLVGTGSMREKKALYIVPEIAERLYDINEVDKNAIKSFKADFMQKKNTLKQYKNVEFFNLPKEGEKKPVFYIYLNGRLYFGFTPRLRLFYDYSLKTGYRTKESRFDQVKSIFGCANQKDSYKSKVSFSDVTLVNEVGTLPNVKLILGAPKSTSYLDYLVQESGHKPSTYNTADFELRGAKRYWFHNNIVSRDIGGKESVASDINALDKGSRFAGKIRFNNLSKSELGLLLWSLSLEKNSQINIGQAKSYGYGRMSVENVKVNLLDKEKAYSLDCLDINPWKDASKDEYIKAYKDYASGLLGKDICSLSSVKTLMLMCDSTSIPEDSRTKYADLDKEYRERIRSIMPLGKPEDIVRK